MGLREKIVVFSLPMNNTVLFRKNLEFAFADNVKKIIGFLPPIADRTGVAGNPSVYYAVVKVNNDRQTIFEGVAVSPDMNTCDGNFEFIECNVDLVRGSKVTGFASHRSCPTNYTAKFHFRVLEEVVNVTDIERNRYE
jgi:hypothetical protein